jgi:hypothetical protein
VFGSLDATPRAAAEPAARTGQRVAGRTQGMPAGSAATEPMALTLAASAVPGQTPAPGLLDGQRPSPVTLLLLALREQVRMQTTTTIIAFR